MTTTVENRIAALEQQVGLLSSELARLRTPYAGAPAAPAAPIPPVHQAPPHPVAAPTYPLPSHPPTYPPSYPLQQPTAVPGGAERRQRTLDLEDLLGGRLLALVGGTAVLIGIAFFCMIAIDNGWVGEVARVLIAAAGSAGLLATGLWLHRRDGHGQAALAMVGTAVAGLWLTLFAATVLYGLVALPAALTVAVGIGVLATVIAVHWDSCTVAALGIGGTLVAPALSGVLTSGGMAFLAVAGASAGAVLVWRRWTWLAVGASTLVMLQVAVWSFGSGAAAGTIVAVVAFFALLNLAMVLGHELRDDEAALLPATPPLVVGGAVVYAGLAYAASSVDQVEAGLAVLAFAVVHAGFAAVAYRSDRVSRAIGHTLLGTAIVLGNIAFAVLANGWVQGVGWALSALLIACTARVFRGRPELLQLTLSGQLALAIAHVLVFDAPTDLVGSDGQATPGAIAAIGSIAVAAGLSARLVTGGRPEFRVAADVVGMVALGFLIAVSLHGVAQIVAWGFASVALARAAAAHRDDVALSGSFGFLGLVAAYTVGIAAPPDSLVTGLAAPPLALVSLAVTAICCTVLARLAIEMPALLRHGCGLVAVGTVLYAASAGIVTMVDGQPGQALMSALWTASGVAALLVGLRRDLEWLRLGGFALLGLAVVKVFLIDLSTLGSLARVGSFVTLGLLLLAAAYGYQHVRHVTRPEVAPS